MSHLLRLLRTVVVSGFLLLLAAAMLTTSIMQTAIPIIPTPALPGVGPESTPEVVVCDPALPPHMMIGQMGKVTEGAPNILRAEPSISAERRAMLPASTKFEVLNGPVCADGYTWWGVRYNEMLGWTAEGGNGQYWLIASGIEIPINQINAKQLVPYASMNTEKQVTSVVAGARMMIGGVMSDGAYIWQLADTFALPGQTSLANRNLLTGVNFRLFSLGYSELVPVQLLEDRVNIQGGIVVTGALSDVYFSPSGNTLAVIRTDNSIDLWAMLRGQPYHPWKYMTLSLPLPKNNSGPLKIDGMAFAKNERRLAIAHNGQIDVFVLEAGYQFELQNSLATGLTDSHLVYNPENKYTAITGIQSLPQYSERSQLQVWDTGYGQLVYAVTGLDAMVMSPPAFNPAGDLIAFIEGNRDKGEIYLRLADASSGRIITSYPLPAGDHVTFDPTGRLLIISDESADTGLIQVWTVQP